MPPIELESAPNFPEIKVSESHRRHRSPRVSKSVQHLMDRMTELQNLGLECDPIQVLMEIAIGKKLVQKLGTTGDEKADYELVPVIGHYDKHGEPMEVDAATRAKAASELCSYLYPKRKAVEVTGAEGTAITFAIQPDTSALPLMPDNVIDAEARLKEGVRKLTSPSFDEDGTEDGTKDGHRDGTAGIEHLPSQPTNQVSQPE